MSSLTLSGVRRLFDKVLLSHPEMRGRLAENAAIVNFPALETGLVKLQRGVQLSSGEKSACAAFRLSDAEPASTIDSDESIVAKAFKRRKVVKRNSYVDVAYVPPTSNECERFFSQAKYVLTDQRKCMDAATVETLLFLAFNRSM